MRTFQLALVLSLTTLIRYLLIKYYFFYIFRSFHKGVKFECTACHKRFSTKENFELHQKVSGHSGEGNYHSRKWKYLFYNSINISLHFFEYKYDNKYVDDIITCIPHNQHQTILTFNSKPKGFDRLQFTIEPEDNRSFSFLDTKVYRQSNGNIITDWFIKPTNSGRYILILITPGI